MGRYEKVKAELLREISLVIHDQMKDPRLGFVTVTKIELSQDLRYAKVFFSVLGGVSDYQRTREALDSALGFIRRVVAERVNLKFAPEISFQEDHSSEYSVRIQQILDEIKSEDEHKRSRRSHKKK